MKQLNNLQTVTDLNLNEKNEIVGGGFLKDLYDASGAVGAGTAIIGAGYIVGNFIKRNYMGGSGN